jgi:hypothetical protein
MLTCGQTPCEVHLEKPANPWLYMIYCDIYFTTLSV